MRTSDNILNNIETAKTDKNIYDNPVYTSSADVDLDSLKDGANITVNEQTKISIYKKVQGEMILVHEKEK